MTSRRADIFETVVNKSEAVKDTKREKGDDLSPTERKQLTDEEKEYKSKRKQIQDKLIKFATRIPAFMYLTDFRDRTVGLQRDHRTPWADTHTTVVDDMDWLCIPHHQLKTHQNWALVEGTGIRPFVPPHDPRHPDRGDPDGRASPANDPPAS